MASIEENQPAGFGDAIGQINNWPQEIVSELCEEVIMFLQYKIGSINRNKYLEKLLVQDLTVTSKKVQSCINAVSHLYRFAAKAELSGEDLRRQLSSGLTGSVSTLSIFTNVWMTKGQSLIACNFTEDKLNIGQLVDLQWKLGMAVSSDSCKSLNFPFVILKLKVSDPSGNLHTHTVEMTLTQFKNFSTQLKEIASLLETV
ncbi:hypothetical protein CHS0354_041942 [Potamilus streckersoni]|uniref:COMM domain-containing protein 6 n=1 Tax=Potamilus streckersoni TaxID=2493646 RepID=A0AAE0TAI9_9BIVA|nr:hypothetical protein CHS0354_041942 [Potamilus streckersoni]